MSTLDDLDRRAGLGSALTQALAGLADTVVQSAVLEIPGARPEWIDTGLDIIPGQQVSVLSRGVVWLARALDVGFEGRLSLWYRIGDGRIAKVIDNTGTFTANAAGRLWLINRWLGEWRDERGSFEVDYPHSAAEGGFTAAVIAWRGEAAAGLARLATLDATGLATEEVRRMATEAPEPVGWTALWRLGRTGIYRDVREGPAEPHITCRCQANAGIITYPVDRPFDDTSRLSWRWRVDALPSAVPEDTLPTHDYVSIAVEFDNGQDLTYFWSASLAVGQSFRCPLPWWDRYETHMVIRSGTRDLGRWLAEERPLLADYRRAVGGTEPGRIARVWLIAVSAFQRRTAACDFAAIVLADRGGTTRIGP
jgi:hypothetical protein